jgi:hypothetical protein
MNRRRDEDAMMMMMMMDMDGASSAFSNASPARHPSSTTIPMHHHAHAREFGLEELFAPGHARRALDGCLGDDLQTQVRRARRVKKAKKAKKRLGGSRRVSTGRGSR